MYLDLSDVNKGHSLIVYMKSLEDVWLFGLNLK